MIYTIEKPIFPINPAKQTKRIVSESLAPLDRLVKTSRRLSAKTVGSFVDADKVHAIQRYEFTGPERGDEPIQLGIFAGIHGDEPAGVYAVVELFRWLDEHPELAAGYRLFAYPVVNPTGFELDIRFTRTGADLNREFWKDSWQPEVQLIQQELTSLSFQGLVSLHSDDTSDGFYGFANGAAYTRNLIEPALAAAEQLLPRNQHDFIDGFQARNGIITSGYDGVLSAPPKKRPRPFEIVFETPHAAPQYLQERALVVALTTVLAQYRAFIAYAANL